jgi:hypothetical protein
LDVDQEDDKANQCWKENLLDRRTNPEDTRYMGKKPIDEGPQPQMIEEG